jgi:hypothetical protein
VVKTWLRRDVLIALGVYTVCATVARGGLATSYHPGDVHHYSTFAHMIAQGKVPYRDFFMEYPPAALVPFLVPQVWAAHYLAIFKALMFVFGAGLILLVGRFVPGPGLGALLVVAVSPFLLGPVFLTRYDLWAAFLGAAALLALLDGGRSEPGSSRRPSRRSSSRSRSFPSSPSTCGAAEGSPPCSAPRSHLRSRP